jgi:hypothetical protein
MLENGHIAESTWDHLVTLGIPPDTDADGNPISSSGNVTAESQMRDTILTHKVLRAARQATRQAKADKDAAAVASAESTVRDAVDGNEKAEAHILSVMQTRLGLASTVTRTFF